MESLVEPKIGNYHELFVIGYLLFVYHLGNK